MCLNSYTFINEQPFLNKKSIFNFLPFFFIFLKCFGRYLKMWKIANLGYGNGRNSKTKIGLTRFLVQMLSRCVSTKLFSGFLILFVKFELYCKIT